jgi:tRNA-dihydrouridine synthase
MLDETGCDGVMIGRAAMGNPWLFREIAHYLSTGEFLSPPTRSEKIKAALEHLKTLASDPAVGEARAVREMRGQLPHYFKGFPGVARLRAELVRMESVQAIESFLKGAG